MQERRPLPTRAAANAEGERSPVALVNERVRVLENVEVGPNLHVVTISAPAIAKAVRPGQFVHMLIPGMEGHILRRPFSIYAADAEAGTVDILYQVVGFGSDHLTIIDSHCGLAGDLELMGPVGHGWQVPEGCERVLLVGGGVGAAPLFMFCEQLVSSGVHVDVVLGAQSRETLVTRERYASLIGRDPACATDDGSYGRAGFCTPLVEEALAAGVDGKPYDLVVCCGPEPLMKIVAGQAKAAGVACQISMEKRMACGVGACLSCVVDTVDGKRRSCVDGPVFDAEKMVW